MTMQQDPRPLVDEPLSLDLLNTRWVQNGARQDLLTGLDGLRIWFAGADLTDRCPADEASLNAVLTARAALLTAVDGGDPRPLNAVLAKARVRRELGEHGPADVIEVDDPAWLAAWLAADDYLRLLREMPDRIKACAHSDCILHFYDTSQNGTRRWCSMAVCGNRAKAARHYARTRKT
ncbi:CGNR zinc finger domain-containing protein [Actinomadura vinacea]|uniref:CGNR zinc finger domain-containing protein n=1 Tax=Actinomadura vinacea TaxID=115336 RepID=A0ABN3JW88_9ACTN